VEHDLLKLFGQATEFVFVLGVLDALQAKVKSLL
jgi:transcription termination factor NusB